MKMMRLFSSLVLCVSLLVSSSALVAMEDQPGFQFDGFQEAATQVYDMVKAQAKAGYAKAVEFIEQLDNPLAPVQTVEVVPAPVYAPAQENASPLMIIKPASPIKDFFTNAAAQVSQAGEQIKETAKNHPILTTVAVAAVVAVPFAIFGYKKAQKAKKQAIVL